MIPEIVESLALFYPRFDECSLQTFDDNRERKDWKLAKIFENKDWNYKYLDDLNRDWAWIFFSVNPMVKWKRDKESVIWISTWICEIDGLDKDIQQKLIDNCPLKPSMVIDSKNSYHMYWFAKEWTKEKRYDIVNWLRNFFDWDPAVVDISRVLRLPWYNHMKDIEKPYMIDLKDYNWEYYTEEQMIIAYPDKRSVSEIKQSMITREEKARKDIWWDYFWDRVKNMDTKNMLDEISWSQFVSWDNISFRRNNNWTEQIRVNWKSTWCWIDNNWKIGSNAWWWPNWTNWVFRYGNCDWKELSRWIRDKHPEMCESKVIKKKEVKEIIIEQDNAWMDFWTITPYSRWLDSLDNRFWKFNKHTLVVTIWESQSGKTEFTFYQARINASNWIKVCYIWLEMTKKNMITRICMKRAWVSKKEWDNKKFTQQQKDIMIQKYKELWDYNNLEIVNLIKPTIENIVETIKTKHNEWYELFYLDNLWFISSELQEIELTALAIRELKELTNSLPIWINILHHFNKWWAKDRTWPRWMASIRSSWKIENDADYVVQVWRDLDDEIPIDERKKVGIFLQKDRIWWDPSSCWIEFDRWDYKEYKEEAKEIKEIKNNDPF